MAPAYGDRIVSATDNSIYQLLPQLIVFPRNVDDLVRLARVAAEPRFEDIVSRLAAAEPAPTANR